VPRVIHICMSRCNAISASLCCTDVGGQIFYGIQPQSSVNGRATVKGLVCNHEDRDRLRVHFCKLIIDRLNPPVAAGTVTIHFWPVIDGDGGQMIGDLFVVGMVLLLLLYNCLLVLIITVKPVILASGNFGVSVFKLFWLP